MRYLFAAVLIVTTAAFAPPNDASANVVTTANQDSTDYLAPNAADLIGRSANKRWTTSFPGPSNQARSPNDRYQMTNVDYPAQMEQGDWHSVFLTDTKTATKKLFYKYGRSIEIVWSPFSDMIALNDYLGSNVSESSLYSLASPEQKVDLLDRWAKSNRPRREKLSMDSADHSYPRVVGWIDRDRLLFKISGHGGIDKGGFTLIYLYNLHQNSFSLLEYLHKEEFP